MRNCRHFILLAILSAKLTTLFCQDENMFVSKDFLIILSTRDYRTALHTARQASAKDSIFLNLRGLIENRISGLTISKAACDSAEETFPSYYARGRWDDGLYISIEYSNAYSGFAKGYYIVIAASGSRKEPALSDAFQRLRRHYPDAYFKASKVYLGCMH